MERYGCSGETASTGIRLCIFCAFTAHRNRTYVPQITAQGKTVQITVNSSKKSKACNQSFSIEWENITGVARAGHRHICQDARNRRKSNTVHRNIQPFLRLENFGSLTFLCECIQGSTLP